MSQVGAVPKAVSEKCEELVKRVTRKISRAHDDGCVVRRRPIRQRHVKCAVGAGPKSATACRTAPTGRPSGECAPQQRLAERALTPAHRNRPGASFTKPPGTGGPPGRRKVPAGPRPRIRQPARRAATGSRGARAVHDECGRGQRVRRFGTDGARVLNAHQDTVGIIGAASGGAAPVAPAAAATPPDRVGRTLPGSR